MICLYNNFGYFRKNKLNFFETAKKSQLTEGILIDRHFGNLTEGVTFQLKFPEKIEVPLQSEGRNRGQGQEFQNTFQIVTDEFPWQVTLKNLGRHFCGGSIINENQVITAAHCIDGAQTVSQMARDTLILYRSKVLG